MWIVAASFQRITPKSIGLVRVSAATRRSVYIHQINRMNSRNDFGHNDSTIVVAIIIIIITAHTLTAVSITGSAESRKQT